MVRKVLQKNGEFRVTFELPADINAKSVALRGEFNNWDDQKDVLRRERNGKYMLSITLPPGEYKYKFFIDNERWLNDANADKYAPNTFGTEDSVLVLEKYR